MVFDCDGRISFLCKIISDNIQKVYTARINLYFQHTTLYSALVVTPLSIELQGLKGRKFFGEMLVARLKKLLSGAFIIPNWRCTLWKRTKQIEFNLSDQVDLICIHLQLNVASLPSGKIPKPKFFWNSTVKNERNFIRQFTHPLD